LDCLLNKKTNLLAIIMNETYEITVLTETMEEIPVTIRKNDTVRTLKLWIAKNEEVELTTLTLTFKGVQLTDDHKELIKDWGVHEGSVIKMFQQISGRGDVTKEKLQALGSIPYKHYKVGEGLNYGGKCENKDCEAYNEPVICQRGLGMGILPFKDQHISEIIRCPGCQKVFTVEKFFFFQCEVKITYKISENDKVQRKSKSVDNEAWEFGSDTGKKATYFFLEFDVTEWKQKQ